MGNPPLTAVILVGLQKCHAAWQQKTTGPHGVNWIKSIARVCYRGKTVRPVSL